MTNPYQPTTGIPGPGDSKAEAAKAVAGNAADRAGDVAATAADHAAEVKDTAVAVGSDVIDTAKAEVANVVDEAKTRAQTLLDEGLTQLRSGAETGQSKLAEVVRSVTDELDEMTRGTSTNGIATQFLGTAQGVTDKAATWLEGKGPDELVDDVRRFAARQPVTFLAIAAGAGFLVSRLARGLQGAAADDNAAPQRFAAPAQSYGYNTQAGYGTPSYGQPTGHGTQAGYGMPTYGAEATYVGGTTMHTTGMEPAGQYGTPGYDQPASTLGQPDMGFGETGLGQPEMGLGYDEDGYPVNPQEPRR